MIMMSVPAHAAGSARSARGTPRNVASGPYMPPSRAMGPPEDRSDHNAGTADQSALAQAPGAREGRPPDGSGGRAGPGGARRRRWPGRRPRGLGDRRGSPPEPTMAGGQPEISG